MEKPERYELHDDGFDNFTMKQASGGEFVLWYDVSHHYEGEYTKEPPKEDGYYWISIMNMAPMRCHVMVDKGFPMVLVGGEYRDYSNMALNTLWLKASPPPSGWEKK